jgi:hypothetical protein
MADQNYQLGALTAAVTALTKAVEDNIETTKALTTRISALENKYRTGRGIALGILLMLGALVYGAKGMIVKLLGVVF